MTRNERRNAFQTVVLQTTSAIARELYCRPQRMAADAPAAQRAAALERERTRDREALLARVDDNRRDAAARALDAERDAILAETERALARTKIRLADLADEKLFVRESLTVAANKTLANIDTNARVHVAKRSSKPTAGLNSHV